jgi:hypothetical protein
MTERLKQSLVCIRAEDRRIIGYGFLVSGREVLTCAHVVDQAAADGEVSLHVPFSDDREFHSTGTGIRARR